MNRASTWFLSRASISHVTSLCTVRALSSVAVGAPAVKGGVKSGAPPPLPLKGGGAAAVPAKSSAAPSSSSSSPPGAGAGAGSTSNNALPKEPVLPLSTLASHFASTPFEPNHGAPSVPETLVVKLRLKAYHKFYLNRFVILLASRFAELGLSPPSQVFLPKKTQLYTVLRSPHVDKRARDQFERVTHKRLITLKVPRDAKAVEFTYRLLSGITTLAPGVEIRAQYASTMGAVTL